VNTFPRLYCCLALCLGTFLSRGQEKFTGFVDKHELSPSDTSALLFHTEFNHFLRNDEYFNPIVEGYTLLGFSTRQGVSYQPTEKVKIYAGVEALAFWGGKPFHRVLPDVSLQYEASHDFNILMGTLPGNARRKMVPQLSDCENMFVKPAERGLEFILNRKYIDWDGWLSWENFLLPGAHDQEQFVVGQKVDVKIIRTIFVNITIPLQFTLFHRGGQINDEFMPVKMFYNNAAGLKTDLKIGDRNVSAEYYFVGHKVASRASDIPYRNGLGHFYRLSYSSAHIVSATGYWNGWHYYSPEGEPIYMSVSVRIPLEDPTTNQEKRKLVTQELYYKTREVKGFVLAAGAELYYDLENSILDYNYTLVMRYSGDFLLKRINAKRR